MIAIVWKSPHATEEKRYGSSVTGFTSNLGYNWCSVVPVPRRPLLPLPHAYVSPMSVWRIRYNAGGESDRGTRAGTASYLLDRIAPTSQGNGVLRTAGHALDSFPKERRHQRWDRNILFGTKPELTPATATPA